MSDFDTQIKDVKKAAKAADALHGALRAASKGASDLDGQAFSVLSAVAEARKSCTTLRRVLSSLDDTETALIALQKSAETAGERSKSRLVAALDDQLRASGLSLEGRLPVLRCGPLALEFVTDGRPEVRIHYGPKVALLSTVSLDPEAMVSEVVARLNELNDQRFDPDEFVRELHAAWRTACARLGLEPGAKAPIISVMSELAAGRQSQGWRNNPTRAAFMSYSRVQFSYDLGRLRVRTFDGNELALTVASRDQTKNPANHLWVDGTHFAYLSFRSA